jgi:death-on-curing protein
VTPTNEPWSWLSIELVRAAHEEQLVEHGGPPGVRDEGLLASALARPRNRSMYESPDVAELAASYAFGIARNHPFIDGNKRTAFVAMEVFLDLNGWELAASDEACVLTMLALAAGQVEEGALAQWVRDHLRSHEI